jgi:hypothetical protein
VQYVNSGGEETGDAEITSTQPNVMSAPGGDRSTYGKLNDEVVVGQAD